jgi:hypothetical protein
MRMISVSFELICLQRRGWFGRYECRSTWVDLLHVLTIWTTTREREVERLDVKQSNSDDLVQSVSSHPQPRATLADSVETHTMKECVLVSCGYKLSNQIFGFTVLGFKFAGFVCR